MVVEIFLWIDLGLSLRVGLSGGVVYSMLLHGRIFPEPCLATLACLLSHLHGILEMKITEPETSSRPISAAWVRW
jgi:xanthosine utilization system XapX-like protein